VISSVMTWNN